MKNRVTLYSENVVDSDDAQALAEEGQILSMGLDIVARVHAWTG